jgi:hypothetical protein
MAVRDATVADDHRGSGLWPNPGTYPDPSFMSVANVVMVFEGSYAQSYGAVPSYWEQETATVAGKC